MVTQVEHQDAAAVLDDFINRVANLPEEIKHMQEEIAAKDRKMDACQDIIKKYDESIQRWIRNNGSTVVNPKEEQMTTIIRQNYVLIERFQDQKVSLSQKMLAAMDRNLGALDKQIKGLQDRGEFPVDAEMQSILNKKTESIPSTSRAEVTSTVRPSSQIHSSSSVAHPSVPRNVSQQTPVQRMLPAQVQAQHMSSGLSASAPATPAAALILQRQQRESSAGAAPKRQRTGLSTAPNNPSGLARHASIGPATPKAGTPNPTRAGSAQPRGTQKISVKKVAPHKQGGPQRKLKVVGKSGLSRVKRTGRNSPSSTNDSELSDADSASQDEDEAPTPPATTRDADGDEDMADAEDEEGGDDKKYCTCQSVSYGDMVACDNESCPFEWFHWTCVGLTSEPKGTWICPVCTKDLKTKQS